MYAVAVYRHSAGLPRSILPLRCRIGRYRYPGLCLRIPVGNGSNGAAGLVMPLGLAHMGRVDGQGLRIVNLLVYSTLIGIP